MLALIVIQAILLFVSAGTLRWSTGWWYVGLYFVMVLMAALVMLPHRSEVVAERSRGQAGARNWDLWVTRGIAVPSLGLLVLAGLDERWHWSAPLPVSVRVFGGLAFGLGYAMVIWAMYANRYFSQVVRIQTERGHVAVTDGPYRYVRHPGYCGMLTSFFGAVFLLDSLYGLICFALYASLVVLRTALEDRTLRAELPGYVEYAGRTRYRLVPGLW